jgi:hypothetical protein
MPRRTLLVPLALLAVLVVPAPALAADPITAVTTPASPFQPFVDESLPPSDASRIFTVAGTSSLPEVSLQCVYGNAGAAPGAYALSASVPVTGGAFSQDVTIPGRHGCRLYALPTGGGIPADLAPYAGPRYFGAERATYTVGGIGPNAASLRDFSFGSTSPTLSFGIQSIGAGGAPYDLGPIDDSGELPTWAQQLFSSNAALHGESTSGDTRSQLQVDGVNAFAPSVAAGLLPTSETASGLPSISVDQINVDPVTRDVTHVSTEPFVTCPTDGGANVTKAAATPANCASFRPSGIAIQRTVVVRNATRSLETKDRYVSTDGSAHEIDALYDQAQNSTPGINGYRFPWVDGATFNGHLAGDEIALPPGRVSTLFAKYKLDAPDDDPQYTQGSLTLAPRPDRIRFTGAAEFEVGFRRTVPATGALAIEQRFTVGTRRADVEAQAASMEQRANAGLGVAITSPTQVSGYDPSYTISGTTTTPGGVRSLVVNGTAVTPKPDGTWSTTIRLARGANALTATVVDTAGDAASMTGNVTFTPGPAQATVLTAGVRKGILSARLRCQTVPGTTCAGRVKLTARITRVKKTKRGKRRSTKTVTLATRAYKLPNGDGAIKTVKLGKANRALVRKYRIKRATLTLTQTVGTFTKTTKTSVPVRL